MCCRAGTGLTVQRDAVKVLGARYLSGHFHGATDERLVEDMLDGAVKLGTKRQLVHHGNGILSRSRSHRSTSRYINIKVTHVNIKVN